MKMTRGFTFNLDALVSVVLASIALAAIVAITSTGKTTALGTLPIYTTAQDVNLVMDKNGTLVQGWNVSSGTYSSNLLANLNRLVPPPMVARLNVTLCTWSDPNINCNSPIIVETNSTEMSEKAVSRRVFTDLRNNRLGLAILEVGFAK